MPANEIKDCPRCQKPFECNPGNIVRCQCYGIKLTEEQQAYIEQHYSDCLCRDCLENLQPEIDLSKEKNLYR